jgi:hypothetical protein
MGCDYCDRWVNNNLFRIMLVVNFKVKTKTQPDNRIQNTLVFNVPNFLKTSHNPKNQNLQLLFLMIKMYTNIKSQKTRNEQFVNYATNKSINNIITLIQIA